MGVAIEKEYCSDQPAEVSPVLPLGIYSLEFKRLDARRLPDYAGSAWRGAFGQALRSTVCVTRQPRCDGCMLRMACAYSYVFETPPPPGSEKMRLYTAAPHPFALTLPEGDGANGAYSIGLTLIGHGNRFLPYAIHAFQRAGQEGIGSQRAEFELLSVRQWHDRGQYWQDIYAPGDALNAQPPVMFAFPPAPDRIRIELPSPLRLKRQEHYVSPFQFRFTDLFRNVLRRVSMLTYFHTDTPLDTDFGRLVQRADTVEISNAALRWHDWTRYSGRQQTTMEMGGLVGSFDVDLQGQEGLWPYLWLGSLTQAGKGTCMGLGQYRIHSLASLPNQTSE